MSCAVVGPVFAVLDPGGGGGVVRLYIRRSGGDQFTTSLILISLEPLSQLQYTKSQMPIKNSFNF